jgi:superfamily II DNA or RNA helicase
VIWDEVHRVGATTFKESVWHFPALLRLGLSATPERKDGKEIVFFYHIGPVKAIAEQMVLIPKVIVEPSGWSVPMTQVKKGNQWVAGPIPHKPGKVGHIINIMAKNYERNCKLATFISKAYQKDRCIIVFSDTLAHLDNLMVASRKFGVKSRDMAKYVGGMKEEDREAAKIKQVIFSTYAFCSEGTDIPWLDTAVLGTPKSNIIQIVGRVLREYDDKKEPLVYDPRDGNSKVFAAYARNRDKWYKSIGAKVVRVKA